MELRFRFKKIFISVLFFSFGSVALCSQFNQCFTDPRGIFAHFTLKNNKNIFGKIRKRVMLAEKNEWFI